MERTQQQQQSQRVLKNPVHQQKIFEEFVKKEKNFSHRNRTEEYTINPATNKPNHITPQHPYKDQKIESLNDDVVDRAFRLDAMRRKIQSQGLQPRQKYPHAMTSNQEIGWYTNPLVPQNKNWQFNRMKTPISDFADNYVTLTKVNPFTIRNR